MEEPPKAAIFGDVQIPGRVIWSLHFIAQPAAHFTLVMVVNGWIQAMSTSEDAQRTRGAGCIASAACKLNCSSWSLCCGPWTAQPGAPKPNQSPCRGSSDTAYTSTLNAPPCDGMSCGRWPLLWPQRPCPSRCSRQAGIRHVPSVSSRGTDCCYRGPLTFTWLLEDLRLVSLGSHLHWTK